MPGRQAPRAPGESAPPRRLAAGAALVAMTVLVYLPAIGATYIWDDDAYVTDNPTLRTAGGLVQIWTDSRATPQYYPLVFSTFWLEFRLWGLWPWGYHVVNVLLHALNAVLLWRVLTRLRVPGAWVAAAAFAVHPVHVESVAWVTERKNVLSTAFYLGAMLAYFRYAPPDPERSPPAAGAGRWYAVSLALYVCALLSKTVTCSLPAALLLIAWWKRGRIERREARALVPFFAVGLGLGLHTAWLEKHHVGAWGADWKLSPVDRLLIAGRALWFYAGKLAWPATLIFIYPRWRIDPGSWRQDLYPLAALAVLAGLWAARGRIGRGPLAAVLFFAMTLVPALGFFDTYPMRYSFVADHFQYLASAGIIALAAALATLAVRRLPSDRRRLGPLAAGVLLAAFALNTFGRGFVYSTSWTLWTDTLEKNPECWMAHNNLGVILLHEHAFDEAERHFNAAVREDPGSAEAQTSLGFLLEERGRLDEATVHLKQALATAPTFWKAHLNLGLVAAKRGDLAGEIAALREALRSNPNSAEAHALLGMALARQGEVLEARRHFARVGAVLSGPVLLSPFSADIFDRTAWMLATSADPRMRNGRLAVTIARRVCESRGARKSVYLNTLAAAYAEVGRLDDAVSVARRALELASLEGAPALAVQIQRRLDAYEGLRAGRP